MRNGIIRRSWGIRAVLPSRLEAQMSYWGVSKELIRLGDQELGPTVSSCRSRWGVGWSGERKRTRMARGWRRHSGLPYIWNIHLANYLPSQPTSKSSVHVSHQCPSAILFWEGFTQRMTTRDWQRHSINSSSRNLCWGCRCSSAEENEEPG